MAEDSLGAPPRGGSEAQVSKFVYVLVAALVLAAVVLYVGRRKVAESPSPPAGAAVTPSESPGQLPDLRKSPVAAEELKGEAAALGNPDAPVVMVEFSDFRCPYCARFHAVTFPQLKEEYIDTGKVYFVYRHFPLGSHKWAQGAAEAAECAREQGEEKFWEMQDAIFRALLSGGPEAIGAEKLRQAARRLGLDGERFDGCLREGRYAERIRADKAEAARVGVRGTPAFVVGSKVFSGAYPFSVFKKVIEGELKAAGK